MIRSSATLLRRGGHTAAGIPAVLELSGAPRGSVYHHFPGGRDQLVAESMQWAGDRISKVFEQLAASGDPAAAFEALCKFFGAEMQREQWTGGCPVATVVLELEPDAPAMEIPRELYAQWTATLSRALVETGASESLARQLAISALAAIEGALIMARAAQSDEPLRAVSASLGELLRAASDDRDRQCRETRPSPD